MKTKIYLYLFVLALLSSCANDKLDPSMDISCDTTDAVTYNNQIKPIIDASCANTGCHDGVSGAPDNYDSYVGMQGAINDGLILNRVITSLNTADAMPPGYAPALSIEELRLIQCWIDGGYLEN